MNWRLHRLVWGSIASLIGWLVLVCLGIVAVIALCVGLSAVLPSWWPGGLLGAIVFVVVYGTFYEVHELNETPAEVPEEPEPEEAEA